MEQKSYLHLLISNAVFVILSMAILFFPGIFLSVNESLFMILVICAPILTIFNIWALGKNPKNKSALVGFTILTSIATVIAIYGVIFAMLYF